MAQRLMKPQENSEIGTNSRLGSQEQHYGEVARLSHKELASQLNDDKAISQHGPNQTDVSSHAAENLARGLKSPNFFQLSGIPKFGKNWLDNFIPDEEMQNTFMTSEVVRNVLMLQCVYFASIFNELVIYKHTFINQRAENEKQGGSNQISMADL